MLEMNHDCNRPITAIICALAMVSIVLPTYWPTIKRTIERKRRARNRRKSYTQKRGMI